MCYAGLCTGFVSFTVQTYKAWRNGILKTHLWETFLSFGGDDDDDGEEADELREHTVSSLGGAIVGVVILILLIGDAFMDESAPFWLTCLAWGLDLVCKATILVCMISFAVEIIVAAFHCDMEVFENFITQCLACKRDLEGYSAVDFEDNAIREGPSNEFILHNQTVEQKPVEEWILTIINWIVFVNVVYIYWLNMSYWKSTAVACGINSISSFCAAGLFMVVLKDIGGAGGFILSHIWGGKGGS